jgi:hypothetical protein
VELPDRLRPREEVRFDACDPSGAERLEINVLSPSPRNPAPRMRIRCFMEFPKVIQALCRYSARRPNQRTPRASTTAL